MNSSEYIAPPRTAMEVFDILPAGTLCYVYNNQLFMSPAPNFFHQKILNKINFQITKFVTEQEMGDVLVAPVDVRLDGVTAFQPDIVFLSNENSHLASKRGIEGAPDFIVEILSPDSTASFDKNEKKAVYEKCGVKEYWMVEPETKACTGFTLENGVYKLIGNYTATIESPLFQTTFSF